MSKTIENFKSGNYEVVDNQGVSVTTHFIECLEREFAELKAKLAESEKKFIIVNNLRKNSDEVLLNYKTEKYGLDKTIQELRKMKLSLPEKEWYYKGFENCERQISSHIADLTLEVKELKQQLAEHSKHHEWVSEFLERYKIDPESTPEYSENPMIEYCEQVYDFRLCDNAEIKDLQEQLAEKDEQIKDLTECNQYLQIYRNQDKISFCIEKLEKVKENIHYLLSFDYNLLYRVNEQIDNQIKQLKEMK